MKLDLDGASLDLARLIDGLSVGVFTLDAEGLFAGWTKGAERLTGFTRAEIVGQPHAVLDTDGSTLETLWRGVVREQQERAAAAVTLRRKGGGEVYALVDLRRLTEEGSFLGVVGSITDLTPHVRANNDRLAQIKATQSPRAVVQRMVGESETMKSVFERLEQAASLDITVLLYGETGTGKELAAHAIHSLSARRDRPLVCVNCSAIPDPLLESELFGHVKGAFTGAVKDKRGVFEAADGGTLFLDEIGDLGPAVQVKLLRAIQERQFRRVGGEKVIKVDTRIVSATHRGLPALVASGAFREDLYYRLRVFELTMPPLRERREDIPLLAAHFVAELAARHKRRVDGLDEEALACLRRYPWPGNVRELRNALESAFVTVKGRLLGAADLPPEVRAGPQRTERTAPSPASSRLKGKLEPDEERRRIIAALREAGGKKSLAAEMLGMSRVTLWKKIKRHGINPVYGE